MTKKPAKLFEGESIHKGSQLEKSQQALEAGTVPDFAGIHRNKRGGIENAAGREFHPDEIVAGVKGLQADIAELTRLFDLQWKADTRAIKRWQAAHPGNDLVWPDRADMVVWLMERFESNTTYKALRRAQRLCKEALPKFDWGKSALDANAITLLNEVPGEIEAALSAEAEPAKKA